MAPVTRRTRVAGSIAESSAALGGTRRPLQLDRLATGGDSLADNVVPVQNEARLAEAQLGQDRIDRAADEIGERNDGILRIFFAEPCCHSLESATPIAALAGPKMRTRAIVGRHEQKQDQYGQKLLRWYDRNRRDLPWRARPGETPDPYAVWLSEVMLQQTTVAAVGAYFLKFMKLWPGVKNLAEAPAEAVMQAWAGLGYYSRARNLHACARKVAAEYGGIFPSDEAELRRLPGVGPYTAAAIAAIAYQRPAIVVDGNVERVVARLRALETPFPQAKKAIPAPGRGYRAANKAGRFRPGYDGPRRDRLHAAPSGLRPVPAEWGLHGAPIGCGGQIPAQGGEKAAAVAARRGCLSAPRRRRRADPHPSAARPARRHGGIFRHGMGRGACRGGFAADFPA